MHLIFYDVDVIRIDYMHFAFFEISLCIKINRNELQVLTKKNEKNIENIIQNAKEKNNK